MNYEALFSLANASVMPAWLLLAFFPNSRATSIVAHSFLYPVLLASLYLFLLVGTWGGDGGMGSLAEVRQGFSRDGVLLLGWVHYLVFDLFVGAWMVRDAKDLGIRHALIIPSLLLTLMLGPIGLMTYVAIRWWRSRKLLL
ncbi:MAG: DUF4281 domain-containing protein [Flavobacteriales bacterium]|nr:DUF4281 domain-containing protein [Flavobacteriales bacterium]